MMFMETSGSIIGEIAEKVTTITVLGIFLNYFMKELKSLQSLREQDKKESDKKFEQIFNRQYEIERQNIEAISRQSDTNLRLTEAINNLSERIENMRD
ncbi:MAG: hypothetical protein BGO69_18805 [Bacteroidetes bacterium 46-16]|nr:MAG: hypothetical protein BGO69_18805 [Bacteroidetes bacterium 46-16]